ncbi:MAG: apolipoprotein N-acyltransferase [Elusimicrobiaceae bacterium]|nr:apolipoprotein N-acyltransferase [Elusimicrobiaceae bacterium]
MSPIRRPFLNEEKAEKKPSRFLAFSAFVGKALLKFFFLLLCSAGTALLFKLSYPKDSHSLLAWLALAPFMVGILRLRGFWGTILFSWFTGTLVYAGLYFWIYITCLDGGGMSPVLAAGAWLGLSGLMGLFFVIFGGSCFFLKRLKSFFPLLAALGWASLEWAHEMLATYVLGFPWFSLGYSQWNLPQIIQIVSYTGSTGLSALIAWCACCVGYAFGTSSLKKGILHLLFAAGLFLSVYGYGYWALSRPEPRALLRLRAAVMQPNIDQYKKWSAEFEQEILDTIAAMGAEQTDKNVMLMIWPESVTPGPVQEEPYYSVIKGVADITGAWQLVGSNRTTDGKNLVSAFLFSPDDGSLTFYDKTHLVPFGEFIPFEESVRKLLPQVQVLGELGAFSAGKWDQPLLQASQVPFGTTICYESVFSTRWHNQAKGGAKFFVNITNDAWFFDTDAPYQHLAVSVLRAAELGRPVLRAANTGISAVISARGEILSRAELNTRGVLQADVPLPLGDNHTFYDEWGAWFAWICAAIYFTILLSTMVFSYE